MEPFRCPDPADRQWVLPLLAAEGEMGCEYNFDNIYLWSRAYPQKLSRLGDRLLVRIQGKLGVCYLYPLADGRPGRLIRTFLQPPLRTDKYRDEHLSKNRRRQV